MISVNSLDYSDFYSGPRPEKYELLKEINSKIIIALMAMVNSELALEEDVAIVQGRITAFVTQFFPKSEIDYIIERLNNLKQKFRTRETVIWGKRYVLEFMKCLG